MLIACRRQFIRQTMVRQPAAAGFYDRLVHLCLEEFRSRPGAGVTLLIVVVVVVLALAIGFPAAYILARRNFRFKSAILLLYFLPLVIPQMTYGIPLATTLYRYGVGGSVVGVILAVLVPMVPLRSLS